MLLQRILTAVPLALAIIWIILFGSHQVFFWLTIIITGIAAFEWAKLSGLPPPARIAYALLLAGIPWAVVNFAAQMVPYYVYAGAIWWFAVCLYLFEKRPRPVSKAMSPQKLVAGVLIIPAAVLAMNSIHAQQNGPAWLLYGLMLIWAADIGAYFSGKRFGRNKLAPLISPGKTREGLLGAVVAACLFTVAAAVYFGLDAIASGYLLLLAIVLTLVSVGGDLYESVLKREYGVKDSGRILPGHGGILDRIDSVLAAMPVFIVGWTLLLQLAVNR